MPCFVSIDKNICMSSGTCVADAPEAFRFDADELAEPTSPSPALSDARLLAVGRSCPSGAIAVVDENGDSLLD